MKQYFNQILESQKVFYKNITPIHIMFVIVLHTTIFFGVKYSISEQSVVPALIVGLPYLFWYESIRKKVFPK